MYSARSSFSGLSPGFVWAWALIGEARASSASMTVQRVTRDMKSLLPGNAIVLTMVAGATPECAVLLIEVDGVDRARGARLEGHLVAHALQLAAYPGRHLLLEQELARLRGVIAERVAHLEAVEVGRLDCL